MVSDSEFEVKTPDLEGYSNGEERISEVIQTGRHRPVLEPVTAENGEIQRETFRPMLEPVAFILSFAFGLQAVIATNLMIDKACRVNLNFTEEVCDNINEYLEQNVQVQMIVTTLNMVNNVLSALPCILVALLVGPWSDLHGRKPLMMIPIIGFNLANIIFILNVYFKQAPAGYIILADIYSLFGGNTCILIGMYAYLADTSTSRSRTTRIAFLNFSYGLGFALGNFVCGFIFKAYGYYTIFAISLASNNLAALYLALFIKDTRGNSQDSGPNYIPSMFRLEPLFCGTGTSTIHGVWRKYSSIFKFEHIAGLFQTCLKRRENQVRRVIWLLMLNMLLFSAQFSDGGIAYLFSRKMFDWDTGTFTRFTTIIIISGTVFSFFIIPFLSFYLQIHDATIAIFDTILVIISLVVQSISKTDNIFILGSYFGILGGQIPVSIRSILSKVTPEAELGKVFSLLGGLEAAIPLAASPLFTVIYNSTMETFTGCVFLVEAGLIAISTFIFCYILYLLRSSQPFNTLVEEEDADENNGTL